MIDTSFDFLLKYVLWIDLEKTRMAKTQQQWFSVDKQGLADLVASKGKVFILHELLQNAWDCPATGLSEVRKVEVAMVPMRGVPLVDVTVTDDDPDGFKDLSHAYTLFAPSEKKLDPGRRGRFNLGEKLVLSLCQSATISTTTGTMSFGAEGRRESRFRRERGTSFNALVRMTRAEYDEILDSVRSLMPPIRTETTINGERLEPHEFVSLLQAELPTVVADDVGVLRTTVRSCQVELHLPREGEKPHIYEMGIPVVELEGGEPWHANVLQKVPLTLDRDNVPLSYLRKLRAEILNRKASDLTPEQAKAAWVTSALGSFDVQDKAVRAVVGRRFGDKAVIADPSDREGEHMAVAQGYVVVPGGSFPAEAWDSIRRADALRPAGQVTPSPRPFSPDGRPLKLMDEEDLTPEIKAFEVFVAAFARRVAGLEVTSCFTLDQGWKFGAAYSHPDKITCLVGGERGTVTFNVGRLGLEWFERGNWHSWVELLIHEFGHHWGHHLDASYHEAICRLGRAAVELAVVNPRFFTGG